MALSLCKWLCVGLYSLMLGSFPAASAARHPFYVSVTEIKHNAADKILEVSCKLFTNDFETALEQTTKTRIDLSNPPDKAVVDKAIADYLTAHLQLKIDGKPVSLQFVGSEHEQEATWAYLQVNNIASVKRVDIVNRILYESFPSEINIMHVVVNGNRQSGKVSNPDANLSFTF